MYKYFDSQFIALCKVHFIDQVGGVVGEVHLALHLRVLRYHGDTGKASQHFADDIFKFHWNAHASGHLSPCRLWFRWYIVPE